MSSLPCPPEHWERFSELLDSAMDLPEPMRANWLEALTGEDAALRPWLGRVLRGAAGSMSDRIRQPNLVGEAFRAGAGRSAHQ